MILRYSQIHGNDNHVWSVLSTLRDAGLTLKAAKCQFAQGVIQYLGHTIGNGEMRPLEAKVK